MSENDWIIIRSFDQPTDLAIIRGRLEAEGIECKVQDELTVQANNMYSGAVGGVKLLIRQKDYRQTKQIFEEVGIVLEENEEPPLWVQKLFIITARFPFIGNLEFPKRLTIAAGFLIILLVVPIVYLTRPSTEDILMDGIWCVESLTFDGKTYTPNTTSMIKLELLGCKEMLHFKNANRIIFPGFNTKSIDASWAIENGLLKVYNADTLNTVFEGYFEVDFVGNDLILQSEKSRFNCSKAVY